MKANIDKEVWSLCTDSDEKHALTFAGLVLRWAICGGVLVGSIIISSMCWTFGVASACALQCNINNVSSRHAPPQRIKFYARLFSCAMWLAAKLCFAEALIGLGFAGAAEVTMRANTALCHGWLFLLATAVALLGLAEALCMMLDGAIAPCLLTMGFTFSKALHQGRSIAKHLRGWHLRVWFFATLVPSLVILCPFLLMYILWTKVFLPHGISPIDMSLSELVGLFISTIIPVVPTFLFGPIAYVTCATAICTAVAVSLADAGSIEEV